MSVHEINEPDCWAGFEIVLSPAQPLEERDNLTQGHECGDDDGSRKRHLIEDRFFEGRAGHDVSPGSNDVEAMERD